MATKPRDRALGFAIVIVIIGLIWWGGSTIRGCFESGSATADGGADGGDAAAASSALASASASAAPPPSAVASANAAPVDAGPPRSPACQAMHDASEKVIAAARAASPCVVPPDVDRLGCVTTAKSTWGFRLDALQEIAPKLDGDSCASFGGRVNLVRIDAAGAETAEIPNLFLFKKDGADAGAFYKYNQASGRFAIAISDTKFFDWDGDGETEVFVTTRIGSTDAEEQSEGSILAWQGGKIAPFPAAADLPIDAVEDIDADGRPDLILRTWKTRIADVGRPGTSPATSIRTAAHSLPDGTFSKKDAAAVAYVQKQCPTPPKLEGLAGGTLTDGDVIACALFWAVPVAKLDPLIAKGPAWTRELAKEKPPFVLK